MSRIINQETCISCGICESECPSTAITSNDGVYNVDKTICNDCPHKTGQSCCEENCPSDSITKE